MGAQCTDILTVALKPEIANDLVAGILQTLNAGATRGGRNPAPPRVYQNT